MKKFGKIIALIAVLAMIFSICVCAAPEDDVTVVTASQKGVTPVSITLSSDINGKTIMQGESFDVAIQVGKTGSSDYITFELLGIEIEYLKSLFDVAVSADQPTRARDCRFYDYAGDEYLYLVPAADANPAKVIAGDDTKLRAAVTSIESYAVSTENDVMTFTFTAKSDAPSTKDVELGISVYSLNDANNLSLDASQYTIGAPITFNIGEVAPEPPVEEEFDDSFEGFVDDKGEVVGTGFETGNVATVFAKATEALAAESYGIWFGGCKYVGKLPVDNGEYWVIKLYDPDGVLDSNETYECEIFTPAGKVAKDYTINPVN